MDDFEHLYHGNYNIMTHFHIMRCVLNRVMVSIEILN